MSNLELEKLVKENEQLRKENEQLSAQNKLYSQFFREAIAKMQELLNNPFESISDSAKTDNKQAESKNDSDETPREPSGYDSIIKSILDMNGLQLDIKANSKQKTADESDKQKLEKQEMLTKEEISLDEVIDSADKVCNISDSLISEDDNLSFDAFVNEANQTMPRSQVYSEDNVDRSEEDRKKSLISILKNSASNNNNV